MVPLRSCGPNCVLCSGMKCSPPPGPYWMMKPVMMPLASRRDSSHWKVMLEGWT